MRSVVSALVAALALSLLVAAAPAHANPLQPLLVDVHTTSVDADGEPVVKTTHVPIVSDLGLGDLLRTGIDVDDDGSLLNPRKDIEVGVSPINLQQTLQTGQLVVPTIRIARSDAAVRAGRRSPPLRVDVEIRLGSLLRVVYGYDTGPGGSIPPLVDAKLTGPVLSGFTNPLSAELSSPGYEAPLTINLQARTGTLDATFATRFEPLPPKLTIVHDPRADGLDDHFDSAGFIGDVKLAAQATLGNLETGDTTYVDALIEHLPPLIDVGQTVGQRSTRIDYDHVAAARKPDVTATLRKTNVGGKVTSNARFAIAGVPAHMNGGVETELDADGREKLKKVDFAVEGADQIDQVDFAVRNFDGAEEPLPAPIVGADQSVQVAGRRLADGTTKTRALGHLEGVRSASFERVGPDSAGIDALASIGDGDGTLRAVLDVDDRGPGAPKDPQRTAVDATVKPLPPTLHARFEPPSPPPPPDAEDPPPPTPGTVIYEAPEPIDVSALALFAQDGGGNDCGEPKVTCLDAEVRRVPRSITVNFPGEGATDYNVTHTGPDLPDVDATIDATPADPAKRTVSEVGLRDVPPDVRGRLQIKDKVVLAAEFHACAFSFITRICDGPEATLGAVNFTVRDQPGREGLPSRPDTDPNAVTVLGRGDRFEAAGRVEDVRHVAFGQRPAPDGPDPDLKPDAGPLGVAVQAAGGAPFDAVVDQRAGDEATIADVDVATLPTSFSVCLRPPREEVPAAPESDPLLGECLRSDVLKKEGRDALPATPLSAFYKASEPTGIVADVTTTGTPKTPAGARPRTLRAFTDISALPSQLRVDLLPSKDADAATGQAARELELEYGADAPIGEVGFAVEERRADAICGDPRTGRDGTCLDGKLKNLPKVVRATFNPDELNTKLDVTLTRNGGPKLSIEPLHVVHVGTKPDSTPIVLDGTVTGIADRMSAELRKLPPEREGEDAKLAALTFDACPAAAPGAAPPPCTDGVEHIVIDRATSSLAGDPLPPAPADVTLTNGSVLTADRQEATLVQRGADFRASADIKSLRRFSFNTLTPAGEKSPTTRIAAALGDHTRPLRAFVDRDDGAQAQRIDAVVIRPPDTIDLCARVPVDDPAQSDDFCDGAAAGRFALQAKITPVAGVAAPTIDVPSLRIARGGRARVITGSARVDDLAREIRVSAATGGAGPAILVQGRDGTTDADIASRATFDLRTFDGPSNRFPFVAPLGTPDPADDRETNRGNFVTVGIDGDRARFRGSIPAIRQVEIEPRACPDRDPRYPDPGAFDGAQAPKYICARLNAAAGEPLGIAVRRIGGDVLRLEDGLITAMPGGVKPLEATIATTPAEKSTPPEQTLMASPVCGPNAGPPCRPPLLSLEAPRADGERPPLLQGVLLAGSPELLRDLADADPKDEVSSRLSYDQSPRGYVEDGARVKLGTKFGEIAVRAGLRLPLHKFLDVDPPTIFTCARLGTDEKGPCLPDNVADPTRDRGLLTKDIAIRLVASDVARGGTPVDSLGRIALFVHDFEEGSQTILTGAPAADGVGGTVKHDPERPHDPADPEHGAAHAAADRGLLAPGLLDARLFLRDDYNAPADTDVQRRFAQVDTRTNRPLSVAVRLNDEAGGRTRDGRTVATTGLTLRNAPATNNGDAPGFRVRAEIDLPGADLIKPKGECDALSGADKQFLGGEACLKLPNPDTRWLDVNLNADPPNGGAPARHVDAAVDLSGGRREVDVVGFTQVGPAGERARIAPQGALRLAPFDLGVRAAVPVLGVGVDLRGFGDLIVGAAGRSVEELRISNHVAALEVNSPSGPTAVTADLKERLQAQVFTNGLFGIGKAIFGTSIPLATVSTPQFDAIPVFAKCPLGLGGTPGGVLVDRDRAKFGPSMVPGGDELTELLGAVIAEPVAALTTLLPPIFCATGKTRGDSFVTFRPPAPRFTDPIRPVPGTGVAPQDPPPPAPPADPPPASDAATIDGTPQQRYCGILAADQLTLRGTIRVGANGENGISRLPGGEQKTVACDGRLLITGREVTVAAGATVDASATRTVGGRGTPANATGGGGGGHHGDGGSSEIGAGGDGFDPPTDVLADTGARGAGGSEGTDFGAGGGAIGIRAAESATVEGTLVANGGDGEDLVVEDDLGACNRVGGGGGAGGRIHIEAKRVLGDGEMHADGGSGGDGVHGGGGGSGGRIGVDSVDRELPADPPSATADGGAGGGHAQCTTAPNPHPDPNDPEPDVGETIDGVDGDAGAQGDTRQGRSVGLAATVERVDADEFVQGTAKLRLSGMDRAGGRTQILLCGNFAGINDPDGVASTKLDPNGGEPVALTSAAPDPNDPNPTDPGDLPPETDLVQALIAQDNCTLGHDFRDGPTDSATDSYVKEITVPDAGGKLQDGFHGFYAIAARPTSIATAQTDCGKVALNPPCVYQALAPRKATARLASDSTAPTVTIVRGGETFDCAGSDTRRCLDSPTAAVTVSGEDNFSGLVGEASCRFGDAGPFTVPCGLDRPVELTLPFANGDVDVHAVLTDAAGNVATDPAIARFHVDTAPPARPEIKVDVPAGTPQENGWYRLAPNQKPTLEVNAHEAGNFPDDLFGSGFGDKPIEVEIDDIPIDCGRSGVLFATCKSSDGDIDIPVEGEHAYQAVATDLVGNRSEPSEQRVLRVDTQPPDSRLLISPAQPDGKDGNTYRTPPVIAFVASDGVGGSGVDLAIEPSAIEFRIDDEAFRKFDPAAEEAIRLEDGIHTVCFRATDVAGNVEPTECREGIRVDTSAPTVELTLDPAEPDGDRGFYRSSPGATAKATEVGIAGLDRVELALDDGPFAQGAEPLAIPDGDHVVRARAFDKAGNVSDTVERVVRVDRVDPRVRLTAFPQVANDRGWFRVPRLLAVGGSDEGRRRAVVRGELAVDGGPFAPLVGEPSAPVDADGNHTAAARVEDLARRGSGTATTAFRIDATTPHAAVALPAPGNVSGSSGTTTLRYDASDALTPKVKVELRIYDTSGLFDLSLRRRIPVAGGAFVAAGPGQVTWDGRSASGETLSGCFHYRVHVTDEAGNDAVSGESETFKVRAPLSLSCP